MQIKKQQLELNTEQQTGSKLGKKYDKAVYCLFNFYAEYIMWNARLDKSQAGIKIARRNINNLRHEDYTTLTESEELKNLLKRVKEYSGKDGLKLNIQKTKSWHLVPSLTDFIFLGSKITEDGDWSHEIKRHLLLGKKAMTNLDSILKSRDITLPTKDCIVKLWFFQ